MQNKSEHPEDCPSCEGGKLFEAWKEEIRALLTDSADVFDELEIWEQATLYNRENELRWRAEEAEKRAEKLETYVRRRGHRDGCAYWNLMSERLPCTCGLSDLLDAKKA